MSLSFEFEEDAKRELERWKSHLPKVVDSYRPSGIVPLTAYPALLAGGILGVPLAIAAGGAVLAAGSLVIFILMAATEFLKSLAIVFVVVVLVLLGAILLLSFLFWVATFVALGTAAGLGVAYFSHLTKNRGRLVSGTIGALSAATAVVGFFLVVQWAVNPPWGDVTTSIGDFFGQGIPGFGDHDFGILAWVNGLLGMGSAMIVGTMMGSSVDKFCENCEEYHLRERVTPTLFENALGMLDSGRSGRALAEVYAPAEKGPISVEIFRCPRCGSGYLEMTAHFEVKYQRLRQKEPGTLRETWLCASLPLPRGEAAEFVRAVSPPR